MTALALSEVQRSQLHAVLTAVRRYPTGMARNDLIEELGLSRGTVDRRIDVAEALGLLVASGRGESTGGRAPDMWRFNPAAGTVLGLVVSYESSSAVLADLSGAVLAREEWETGMRSGPEAALPRSITALQRLRLAASDAHRPWAVGVCLPTPVDFRTGEIVESVARDPQADAWTGLPLRRRLEEALGMPVWVEDEVNAMAIAASTRIGAPEDLLYLKVSMGIRLGIVSHGVVHRGVGAASGEIAHLQVAGASGRRCRCGRRGCLETVASGLAMTERAMTVEARRASSYLRGLARPSILDVCRGSVAGDRVCHAIVQDVAERLGSVLAVVVTTYNPGEIVVGGDAVTAGEDFTRAVGHAVRARVLPVLGERLLVRSGDLDDALTGICRLVSDRLISPTWLGLWLEHGSPVGASALVGQHRQDL